MPECRSAGSLQQTCLKSVCSNMDFWCRNFAENFKVMKTFKYFIGPFDDLSSDVSMMLLEQLMIQRNLKRPYLYLLINQSLVNLNLSGCPMLVKDDIINVALFRCKGLKSINLSNCIQIKKETLVALSEAYPNLASLNLNGTKCAEEAAKAVFKNCTQVKELILSHCLLDDDDLSVLINSVTERETHRNLRRLSLFSTNVTHQALSTVLRNLPWVTLVEHMSLAKSIHFMNKDLKPAALGDGDSSQETLKLRSLTLDENVYIFSSILAHCFRVCPHLVKIEFIQVFGYNNECFAEMGNLTMLRDLKIVCNRQSVVDFTGVQQALDKIGPNLEILVLEDIDGIDLLKTAKLCPNVTELSLTINEQEMSFHSGVDILDDEYPLKEILLTKLKKLSLGGNGDEDNEEPVLTRFLSACCAVENLKLIQINELTDDVLRDTLKVNEMVKLTSLEVFACENITNDSLGELILSPANKLSLVKIMDCWNITRKDYSDWLATAKERNYNLEIDWN